MYPQDRLITQFPFQCIYGRPGQPMLVSQMSCPVLHHNTSPTWYEEIKLRLPLRITTQHHLLFSFFHVSCNIAKKKDLVSTVAETPVGYAWLPLLSKGKLNIEEQCLPVAASLPAGYLSIQPLGLGRGVSFMLPFFVFQCMTVIAACHPNRSKYLTD